MQYPEKPNSDKGVTFRIAYVGDKPTFYEKKSMASTFFIFILAKKVFFCKFFEKLFKSLKN